MKPICIKGLKQRQSTPTLHGPREVYKILYESLEGKYKAFIFNLEYRLPIECWSWTCGAIGMHVVKLKQAGGMYNIFTL